MKWVQDSNHNKDESIRNPEDYSSRLAHPVLWNNNNQERLDCHKDNQNENYKESYVGYDKEFGKRGNYYDYRHGNSEVEHRLVSHEHACVHTLKLQETDKFCLHATFILGDNLIHNFFSDSNAEEN